MRKKKSKVKFIKPRAPIYGILGKGGVHKSEKDYSRQKEKKGIREILKNYKVEP